MEMSDNLILMTDSYKVTHWKQYPPGTEYVYSYFESRGGKWDATCFFGLQYILKRYLVGQVITQAKIDEAEEFFGKHLGLDCFNRQGWEYILKQHNGHLPVVIKAVSEGEVVTNRNVLITIENTDPECYWLPNYLETLLVQVWYPCTVTTNSREQKKIISKWMSKTGCQDKPVEFKLHDFGFRGVSSVETAGIGACSHLINFRGTDTMAGLVCARRYYSCDMAGYSIPASEHSTMTSWGETSEVDAYRNMIEQYPSGLVACVSDSWDVFNACSQIWGLQLRDKVMARDGTLVIRPDSGDPATTVCRVLDILGGVEDPSVGFSQGITFTSTGHKLLPSYIRIIQGDGIDAESLEQILSMAASKGWAADNISFGSGGALLQRMNRDTLKFAFKCSHVTVNGEERDVHKDPVTDPGKRSKAGKLCLILDDDNWKTVSAVNHPNDALIEVFKSGLILVEWTLDEIRLRARI